MQYHSAYEEFKVCFVVCVDSLNNVKNNIWGEAKNKLPCKRARFTIWSRCVGNSGSIHIANCVAMVRLSRGDVRFWYRLYLITDCCITVICSVHATWATGWRNAMKVPYYMEQWSKNRKHCSKQNRARWRIPWVAIAVKTGIIILANILTDIDLLPCLSGFA